MNYTKWLDLSFGDKRERNYWELTHPLLIAFVLLFLRYFLKKCLYEPFGIYMGLTNSGSKKYSQVKEWWNLRKVQNGSTILDKFCENCWAFTFYAIICVVGITVLWEKPWLWDINECWRDFYRLFQMTSTVMSLAWRSNFFRICTLGNIVNDVSDVLVEGAKAARYLRLDKMVTALFATFVPVWLLTRIGILPFWIMKNFLLEAHNFIPVYTFPIFYVFISLLVTFCVLNCVWTYFIIKAITSFTANKKPEDKVE